MGIHGAQLLHGDLSNGELRLRERRVERTTPRFEGRQKLRQTARRENRRQRIKSLRVRRDDGRHRGRFEKMKQMLDQCRSYKGRVATRGEGGFHVLRKRPEALDKRGERSAIGRGIADDARSRRQRGQRLACSRHDDDVFRRNNLRDDPHDALEHRFSRTERQIRLVDPHPHAAAAAQDDRAARSAPVDDRVRWLVHKVVLQLGAVITDFSALAPILP